ITEEAPGKSDMRHGRKLYYQLYRAGYRKIHMFAEPILLPNLSVEERQALYAIWFHHRLQPWLDALDDGHPKASEYIAKLSVSLEEYELDMEDPSFFFLALGIGAVAEV
ncbi:hypothetical protein, partial [Marinobacter sp.]|uniref:hypothetical protein n=1 Tax=Marinobacter sp. TaxID=50741 RepID=UPI002B47FFF0